MKKKKGIKQANLKISWKERQEEREKKKKEERNKKNKQLYT